MTKTKHHSWYALHQSTVVLVSIPNLILAVTAVAVDDAVARVP